MIIKKLITLALILLGSCHMHVAYGMKKEPKHKIRYSKEDFIEIFNNRAMSKIYSITLNKSLKDRTEEVLQNKKLHHICRYIIMNFMDCVDDFNLGDEDHNDALWSLFIFDKRNTKHDGFNLETLLEFFDDYFIKESRVDPDDVYNKLCVMFKSL